MQLFTGLSPPLNLTNEGVPLGVPGKIEQHRPDPFSRRMDLHPGFDLMRQRLAILGESLGDQHPSQAHGHSQPQ